MRPTIRDASPFDIPDILDMLRSYRKMTPLPFLAEADDAEYVTQMLTELMAGKGLVLIADKDGIAGMLIAIIAPSIWSPKHVVMTELAYWVEPECRGGTMGYRLIAEYKQRGDELKKNGRITNYLISKMSNSPNLQYQKFGFEKLEEFWVA
jgi:N-acetylglutamate synthase-like GNAT family acetyltransferase